MKKISTLFKICFSVFILSIASCSTDDNSGPNEPINTEELKLFVIDTAKVNTITMTGTNEQNVLNKSVNSSSYIGDFCISPDGAKFIYVNHQMTGVVPNLVSVREIRKANIDGSNDVLLYAETQNQTEIQKIKYCSDGKIIFSSLNYQVGTVGLKVQMMNEDGTGLADVQYGPNFIDVTADRGYYLINTDTGVQILDADADNGAPGFYYSENIATAESIEDGVFTSDAKTAVIPYKEGNMIKAKVIDIVAKTSTTIDLISGLGTGWISYHLEMSSDSKRGVITISGSDYIKSKTYVFDVKTGVVNAPFENNDENIFDVYAW